jgi:hypothetical protein
MLSKQLKIILVLTNAVKAKTMGRHRGNKPRPTAGSSEGLLNRDIYEQMMIYFSGLFLWSIVWCPFLVVIIFDVSKPPPPEEKRACH